MWVSSVSMEIKRWPKRLINVESDGETLVPLSASDLMAPRQLLGSIIAFEGPVRDNVFSLLEDGLSEALRDYKELAGRLSKDSKGRPAVHLNGAGAGWIEAEASVALCHLMPFTPGPELFKLSPPSLRAEELLLVQVTVFRCGGFTVATVMHHSVADGKGSAIFMRVWSSAVKSKVTGVKGAVAPLASPFRDRALLIPASPASPKLEHQILNHREATHRLETDRHRPLVAKQFHFGPEILRRLKVEAMKDMKEGAYFSTFECLTAHIWRCITRARGLSAGTKSSIIIAVDGRPRIQKTPSENYIGNVYCEARAQLSVQELTQKPLSFVADKLHGSIERVDNEFIWSAWDSVELRQRNSEPIAMSHSRIMSPDLGVSSLAKLPFYKTDFGWGEPLFICPDLSGHEGHAIYLPHKRSEGSIDAFVALFASDAERFHKYAFELPTCKS